MDVLILDIGLMIYDLLNFVSQVNLRLVSKHFAANYFVTNLFDNVPNCHKLTDDILKNYCHVLKLNDDCNPNVNNVNHMIKLKKLHAYVKCGIDDNGLSKLNNMIELHIGDNKK